MLLLQALTKYILSDGSALFIFQGPAGRVVVWSITSGAGTLTAFSIVTDAHGYAYAIYNALGFVGDLTVQVQYGG